MEGMPAPAATRPKVGGWLVFFAITLVAIGPLVRLISLAGGYPTVAPVAAHYPRFGTIYLVTAIVELALIVWSIIAGVSILRVRPSARLITKMFLIANPVAAFFCSLAFRYADLPAQAMEAMASATATIASRAIIYSIIWGLYMAKSRRVRETFGGTSPAPVWAPGSKGTQTRVA